MPDEIHIVDGSVDFSGGIDSNKVTTIQSTLNASGLPRNMLPWLVNGTVRNGGVRPRSGWIKLGDIFATPGLFQGAVMYTPSTNAYPYLIFLMDGVPYAIFNVDQPGVVVDLSGGNVSLRMPSNITHAYFCQAEQFLVIQAGDYVTKPLFWDGLSLRRSLGIISANNIPTGVQPYNEIPAAGPMTYYMGRLWYAFGRTYSAGDIVGNQSSGTAPYNFRDSVLKVTENPLAIGGDGFTVPSDAGNIRALDYSANLNSLLGQGTLYIFTREQIYSLTVPVTRTAWTQANSNNMPLQFAVQIGTGSVNDRSIVSVNGDLFFQTIQPSIQSLTAAVRNFNEWGDTPVSVNEDRILAFNDRALLYASSGIYFDNRLLETALPFVSANGVVHRAIIPLNFDPSSTLGIKGTPIWEGQLGGLAVLQLVEGDFGGLHRGFAISISDEDQSMQLWELTKAAIMDKDDNRITWLVETPSYTWGKEFQLKELVGMEMWIDDLRGTAEIIVEYRPDSDSCWYDWHRFKICAARDQNEKLDSTNPYPTLYGPGYRSTLTLAHPPNNKCSAFTARPAYMCYQAQVRLTIHGWLRVRGIFLHAIERDRELYAAKVC